MKADMIQTNSFRGVARLATGILVTFLFAGTGLAQHAGPGAHTQHAGAAHHGASHAKSAELGTAAVADKNGRLWAVAKEASDGNQFVTLQSSDDMGKTWTPSRRVHATSEPVAAHGEARPHIALGKQGELYISWTKTVARPHIGDIRFVRSLDGGNTFSEPVTVHANRDVVTHSFESMIVDREGRIYVAWIDGRDQALAKAKGGRYAGSAVYYAVSDDKGATFKGDYKVADHSCECCRIGLGLNEKGQPVAMWRHVFEPNIRDHAVAVLTPDGKGLSMTRATFDDWKIDACPHHGPSLAYGNEGVRHQVWFNGKETEASGALYARTAANGTMTRPVALGSAQASHADVAASGNRVVIVWKQFDGKVTRVLGRLSEDNGISWKEQELAHTEGDSDKPYLVATPARTLLLWRTQREGIRLVAFSEARP
jgi:hypothetical protein